MRTRGAAPTAAPAFAEPAAEPAAPAQPQPKFRADDCVRGVRWAEVCSGAAITIDGAAPHISGGIGDAVPATVLDGSDKKRYQVTERGQFSVAGQTAANPDTQKVWVDFQHLLRLGHDPEPMGRPKRAAAAAVAAAAAAAAWVSASRRWWVTATR